MKPTRQPAPKTTRPTPPSTPPAAPPPSPAGSRRRALRWLLAASPLLLLLLAEGALRAFGPPADAGDEGSPHADRRLELTDARLFEPDPELFWRLLPDRTLDVGDPAYPLFRTNHLGLRGPGIVERKGAGEVRVVCAGDSVTFGLGLLDSDTFPDRLEVLLRDDVRLLGRGVRVVNAGVPGYSSVQGVRLVKRLLPLKPDVVVWWFGMNDAKAAQVRDARLDLPGPLERKVSEVLGGLRVVQTLRSAASSGVARSVRVPPEDFTAALAELHVLAAQEGFRVVHVRCPNRLDETLRELREVTDAADRAGVEEVRAPFPILSPWTPSPRPAPLRFSEEPGSDGRKRLLAESGALASDRVASLAEVRRDRDAVARWKDSLDALLARLPESSIGGETLFRGAPPFEVMTDNCHLSKRGAAAAGEALRDAVLAELEVAGKLGGR